MAAGYLDNVRVLRRLRFVGLRESEEKPIAARPQMIGLLDSIRHLLEELSPELGVTDPVSGTVVFEKQIN